jgi:hypothetical protein
MPTAQPTRRRWFRFSIGSMLWFTITLGLVLAFGLEHRLRVLIDRDSAAEIAALKRQIKEKDVLIESMGRQASRNSDIIDQQKVRRFLEGDKKAFDP